MAKNTTLNVQGTIINITRVNDADLISITDICKGFGDDTLVYNWMRNRNTVEFLGVWESLNNPDFKGLEFETFRKDAGLNNFTLTPKKWIDATGAIGIQSRSGRYGGGTFAHKEIALEFCAWLSPTFRLYLIKEFDRLKALESSAHNMEWNVKRVLSKTNYQLHTAAIKEHRIPKENIPKEKEGIIYADEAEILNYAVFGYSSKEWRQENPALSLKGQNLRDFASINELAVLANMESINSIMLASGMPKTDRIVELRRLALDQLSRLNKFDFEKSFKRTVEGTFINQIEQTVKGNNQPLLSSFNQKLNTALNYNPKDKGEKK